MEKRVFEFAARTTPVTIAGHDFVLDCSTKTGDYLKGAGIGLEAMAQEIKAGTKTPGDAIAYGMEIIDHLLGDGAADTIFEGRERTISDLMDVCVFLAETAAEYQTERQKTVKNRAPRRAEKKK